MENDYKSRKQQELSRKIFEDLTDRYEVRMMSLPSEQADNVTATEDKALDDKQDTKTESDQEHAVPKDFDRFKCLSH